MQHKFRTGVIAILLAASFGAAFWIAKTFVLRGQQAGIRPFTATIATALYHGDSSRPLITRYTTVALRGDGSEVTVRHVQAPDGNPYDERVILDLASAQRVTVDPMTQSRTTYPLTSKDLAHYKSAEANCAASPGAATSTILGYAAVKSARRGPAARGKVFSTEDWRAPALGCLSLSRVTVWTNSATGAVTDRQVRKVLTIIEGDPTALFTVPSGYGERSPSEVLSLFASKFNKPEHPQTGAALDRVYQSHAK
ncbi:MAG: hypothetical protein ACRD3D_17700 [Terriglobia bacterium]